MIPIVIVAGSRIAVGDMHLSHQEATRLAMDLCEAADQARAHTEWARGDYADATHRLCPKCGETKPIDTGWYYNKSRGSFNPGCRTCTLAARKARKEALK